MKLPPGKIPIGILRDVVFRNLGVKRDEVVLGPSAGIDGAVIDVGNRSVVVSMDPITGAIERIGWLSVNINANDVATFGVEPAFFLSCILLPEGADKKTVEAITAQMNKAATDLRIAIVGGHCEVTLGLKNPIVVGCTLGITDRGNYITAGEAKPRDHLILTKSAGIEGTAILASDRETQLKDVLNIEILNKAKRLYEQVSVVKDAITAFRTGGVNAMHDPTEGGIAGAIHEMADASNLGVKISKEKIRIRPETKKVCEFFRIDPLQLTASGSLLIAAKPSFSESIVSTLESSRICAEIIGEFLPSPEDRVMTYKDGRTENLVRPVSDHLWKALEKTSIQHESFS
jgi:hydrogenase expression/formation protein HypE